MRLLLLAGTVLPVLTAPAAQAFQPAGQRALVVAQADQTPDQQEGEANTRRKLVPGQVPPGAAQNGQKATGQPKAGEAQAPQQSERPQRPAGAGEKPSAPQQAKPAGTAPDREPAEGQAETPKPRQAAPATPPT
ncbi:hypothetical protein E4O86_17280, partial [Rhizobiales bacterium L72]|nr:hypothetical protein [Propylenella binzhouense]